MASVINLRGFWKLTWLEAKIFAREPMGFVGSLLMPVIIFLVVGKAVMSDCAGGRPVLQPRHPRRTGDRHRCRGVPGGDHVHL
jgi:hypothetical protein